mmetsp:Transcript_32686/g.75234  ORF Transcript_32686/g.75234 Transcript_32686/m.75234 type:complete len:446 (-) Transcript_32686:783-2120(-)
MVPIMSKAPSSKPSIIKAGATAALLLAHTGATAMALSMASPSSRPIDPHPRPDPPPAAPHERASSFSFGVIADVQWADADDGTNYAKTVRRRYRGAFRTLGAAVDHWRARSLSPLPSDRPLFVAQLGDLVDGLNARLGESDLALDRALRELDRAPCPAVNLVGNHELYNFDRAELARASWLRRGDREFYSFRPHEGWRVVVLDPYQIALIGHAEEDPRRLEAVALLAERNPNVSPDGADGGDWFDGMERGSPDRRFVPYNGGFGKEQLDWFAEEVTKAAEAEERVIVMSHVIIHPKACGGSTMAWDYEKALDIIHSINQNGNDAPDADQDGVVVAVLCGHDHSGNYHQDEMGVHHCTFSSPLNKGTDGKAFGMIKVTPDGMEIRGPKVDDLLPNVHGRPPWTSVEENDDGSGPSYYESIVLPFARGPSVPSIVSAAKEEVSPLPN